MTTKEALKFIAGADVFGCKLKDKLVAHLREVKYEVEDLGVGPYYSIGGASGGPNTRGLVSCGTGIGVAIFANKFPGYALLLRMPSIVAPLIMLMLLLLLVNENTGGNCALCCLAENREFVPVEIMPGGMMKIVRESPTSAIVKFKAGSVEPAHHHSFGHDLIVMKGKKSVWNLSKKEKYDLGGGDYLFTPAGDVHRVKYYEDTEFFIKWEGLWDIFLDEDLDTAKAAIDKEG